MSNACTHKDYGTREEQGDSWYDTTYGTRHDVIRIKCARCGYTIGVKQTGNEHPYNMLRQRIPGGKP